MTSTIEFKRVQNIPNYDSVHVLTSGSDFPVVLFLREKLTWGMHAVYIATVWQRDVGKAAGWALTRDSCFM